MSFTMRRFASGLVLALFVLAPSLVQFSAAQDPRLPLGLDLNGTWELEERGELLSSQRALVKIMQTPEGLVRADFLAGAECFNGLARPYAFIGQLSFKIPGEASLSAPTMFVCSGSPSAVKRCAGSIPAVYASKFTNVLVMADLNTGKPLLIAGQRFAQGYDDCTPDSRYDGTHPFVLRRLTCPVEARKVSDREADLRDVVTSIFGSRATFSQALDAAKQRYPNGVNGRPTSDLEYPYDLVHTTWDSDIASMEVFVNELPRFLASNEWKRARDMAAEMGLLAVPPVLEVREMLDQMYKIEDEKAAQARQALDALTSARAELAKCQQAPQ